MRYALKEVASLTFTVLIIWSTTDVFGDNRPIQKSVLRDSVLQHKLPTTKQLDLAQTLGESCTVRWNPDNGTPLNIRCAVNLKGKAVSIPSAAEQFLREYAGLFKIKDPASELKEEQTVTDELGKVHVRYSQELGGIRVWGSYLLLHFNPDFTLYAVSANSCPTPMPVNQSKIMRDLAESKVVSNISEGKEHCKLKSDLVVFPNNDQFFYAWAISIADSVKLEECWQYFIDAETGQILLKYRDVHDDGPAVGTGTSLDGSTKTINTYQYLGTYQMVDASKIMYTPPFTNFTGVILTVDCYNDTSTATDTIFYDYNSNNQFNESVYYRAGVDAHFNMGKIYDFFVSVQQQLDTLGC